MRSTFWPNRIFDRQSSQNRKTGLKFSSRRVKKVRFPWKLYKTLFSGHAQHVLAKSHFWPSKFSKSQNWPQILLKTVKQCAFHENCTKRSFQIMRSTFWPNRIFERQSSQNRHFGLKFSPKRENSALPMKILPKRSLRVMRSTFWPNRIYERQNSQNRHPGLKFSPKRENSALFMKIEQNDLFRSCAAHFREIEFLSVKVLKIGTLAWNSRQKGKTERFYENCTKRSFQVMRSTFWPNRIFERQSSQNRQTGLKFSPNRENSALLITIVQNALFRSCAARFGQIALLSGKVLKIVKLASNSLQNGKTVRFPWKLYKTLFLGHAVHVLAELHLWAWKFSKSSHWPEILAETGKQCALQYRSKVTYHLSSRFSRDESFLSFLSRIAEPFSME